MVDIHSPPACTGLSRTYLCVLQQHGARRREFLLRHNFRNFYILAHADSGSICCRLVPNRVPIRLGFWPSDNSTTTPTYPTLTSPALPSATAPQQHFFLFHTQSPHNQRKTMFCRIAALVLAAGISAQPLPDFLVERSFNQITGVDIPSSGDEILAGLYGQQTLASRLPDVTLSRATRVPYFVRLGEDRWWGSVGGGWWVGVGVGA